MVDIPLLLLVEDEPSITELLKDALEEGGFEVRTAITGDQAMALLDECAGKLSGLITDVDLKTEITGWDIARHARESRPDLPIVYTSGGFAADWPINGVPNSLLVPKPFAPAQVITAISTLITEATSHPGTQS